MKFVLFYVHNYISLNVSAIKIGQKEMGGEMQHSIREKRQNAENSWLYQLVQDFTSTGGRHYYKVKRLCAIATASCKVSIPISKVFLKTSESNALKQ